MISPLAEAGKGERVFEGLVLSEEKASGHCLAIKRLSSARL